MNNKRVLSALLVVLMVVALFGLLVSISLSFNTTDDTILDNDDNFVGTNDDETFEKQLYCIYDASCNIEYASEGLKIYMPSNIGYINYNVVHSVNSSIHVDTWRLGQAFSCDDEIKKHTAITSHGAEWDMAVRIQGRDDFIGGCAHGDEKYSSFDVKIDGTQKDVTSLNELTPFNRMVVSVDSIGYDPNDHASEVLLHHKEYTIDARGITLNQKVEFLGDYLMSTSYLAMMPPLKTLTDTYYTDVDFTPTAMKYGSTIGATKAVVYGSNYTFIMSIPKYPMYASGNRLLLQDNGGLPYNKMYFMVCNGENVAKGDIWESTTKYQITNKE